MYFFVKLYYRLTGWVPRLMPRSEGEYVRLRKILLEAFHVPDRPEVWYTIAGFISSTKVPKIRQSYRFYANVAKRLDMNEAAKNAREQASRELEQKIDAIRAQMKAQEAQNETAKANSEAATGNSAASDSGAAAEPGANVVLPPPGGSPPLGQ